MNSVEKTPSSHRRVAHPRGSGRMPQGKVGRRDITDALTASLKRLPYALAFWEGGSAAFGRADEWSDLDLYVLVKEGRAADAFRAIERALEGLSPIELTYPVLSGFEGVSQKFYRLRDANEFAVVDLAILTPDSPENFLTPEIHGRNLFYFNKRGVAEARPLDKPSFDKRRRERLERLVLRFEMFNNYVAKELERGHSLEALEDYRAITLATLVEALRMKYAPLHYDFRMHYVDRELPSSAVKRLVRLSYVRNQQDLRNNYREATRWCTQVLGQISNMV